eukprot:745772-Hanusia_phi.AAC.1
MSHWLSRRSDGGPGRPGQACPALRVTVCGGPPPPEQGPTATGLPGPRTPAARAARPPPGQSRRTGTSERQARRFARASVRAPVNEKK